MRRQAEHTDVKPFKDRVLYHPVFGRHSGPDPLLRLGPPILQSSALLSRRHWTSGDRLVPRVGPFPLPRCEWSHGQPPKQFVVVPQQVDFVSGGTSWVVYGRLG